jgi:hypothetical protein
MTSCTLHTNDCPEKGVCYSLTFPLKEGGTLTLCMGDKLWKNFKAMIEQMEIDDLADSQPADH